MLTVEIRSVNSTLTLLGVRDVFNVFYRPETPETQQRMSALMGTSQPLSNA